MITEKFKEVLMHEGVVSIVSCDNQTAHVCNTWNSYVQIIDDKLYIPVYGMKKTERNTNVNNLVKLTLGTKELMGYKTMGLGYYVEGEANFIQGGEIHDSIKAVYPWANRILEVTVTKIRQTV